MVRPYVAASVALAGAGVIAVTPIEPPLAENQVQSSQVRLAAAPSPLNIPLNLAIDLINVPYNQVGAIEFAAKSLFFSGPWMVVSATNLWGVDPGDPSHFQSVLNFSVPFPALSGMNLDQSDQNGLGQQLWYTVATILPVSSSCDAEGCIPFVPSSPITGITGFDEWIWPALVLTGQLKFPMISNWFDLGRISQLFTGYTFGPEYSGYANPSGPAYPIFDIPGTTEIEGPDGPEYLMPFADTTFKLDPFKPFQNYFNHLMEEPFTDNPIQLPDLEQFGRAIQAMAAALVVAFDPFTAGSPFCPGSCDFITPAIDYPEIARFIGSLWPGNEIIDAWLAAYDSGKANVPTEAQIDTSVEILQDDDFWNFGKPSPPAEWSTGVDPSTYAPFFHDLWTNLGFNPPPLSPTVTDPAPVIAALKQEPVLVDVETDPSPEGDQGQESDADAPTDASGESLQVALDDQSTAPAAAETPESTPTDTTSTDTTSTDTTSTDTTSTDTTSTETTSTETTSTDTMDGVDTTDAGDTTDDDAAEPGEVGRNDTEPDGGLNGLDGSDASDDSDGTTGGTATDGGSDSNAGNISSAA